MEFEGTFNPDILPKRRAQKKKSKPIDPTAETPQENREEADRVFNEQLAGLTPEEREPVEEFIKYAQERAAQKRSKQQKPRPPKFPRNP